MMKDFVEASLGIIIAFMCYALLLKISAPILVLVNVFGIVVIMMAVEKGEVFGSVFGAVCGLIQDSFSIAVFGVSGIAFTIVGYLAGSVAKRIDIYPVSRCFVFFFLLLSFGLLIWHLMTAFILSQSIYTARGLIIFQPLATTLLGILVFRLRKRKK
jgi:rod shape-determining protein MreD